MIVPLTQFQVLYQLWSKCIFN